MPRCQISLFEASFRKEEIICDELNSLKSVKKLQFFEKNNLFVMKSL